MKVKAIKNANIVLENSIIWDGTLIIENEKITAIAPQREIEIPQGADVIDAGGAYVGPGFVDLHVHGGNGFSTCFEPEEAADFFLRHGSTSFLSTPDYGMNFDTFMEAIRTGKKAMKTKKNIKGLYLEGPYTNPEYGAQAYKNPWRHPICEEEFKALVDEAGTDAKVWTIAPEREGLLPFLEYARKVNPDVVFSVGHSEATPEQIQSLGIYKPILTTHIMCATGRNARSGGTRGAGPDEYAFLEPDVFAELISDSCAIHVRADLQRMILQHKGIHRIALITDGTVRNNPAPEHLAHVTDINFNPHGGISGSKLTMDMACKNIMTHTGCGIVQAFVMASLNPAKVLGMDKEIGSIEIGKIADLVFVDDKFNVKQVMLGGKLQNFQEEDR